MAERNFLSIVNNCKNKLNERDKPSEMCDAFMGYFIKECEKFDNLLNYCEFLIPYDNNRHYQQECLKNDTSITGSNNL